MEGSKTSFEIFKKDNELYAHLQKIIMTRNHWVFRFLILLNALIAEKSTSSYIYLLARRAISWKSAKKVLIESFTMTTKYIACYEVSNHANWLKNVRQI